MNNKFDNYPKGYTVDQKKYIFTDLLGGVPLNGLWQGRQTVANGDNVLIAMTSIEGEFNPTSPLLRAPVAGLAPVLYVGLPDQTMGTKQVVVERLPSGVNLMNAGNLTPHELVSLGISLCDLIRSWDSEIGIFRGLRPKTVYISGDAGRRRFSGATPRVYLFLGNDGMYAAFSPSCYDPPAHNFALDIALDDEVFVVGLLMWFALLGEHPYRKMPGHPYDYDNIWEDVRHPFTGPAELGRLLDAVLVADPDRRMKAQQFRAELVQLAHTWNVELPPFPPPGLWAGPASKKMTE